ncbi:Aminoglycoside phosphotransferase [Neofusicoccum parvum]|uniref:Aminoglycoside phosphotransferase n=1 Tax=Neofusicoccum parvum TaxID=310453 RepID=A0ACB5RWE2_9PEZI|nr:Aminoglycoside phosphotransferase [Neofusicoccum parvum]
MKASRIDIRSISHPSDRPPQSATHTSHNSLKDATISGYSHAAATCQHLKERLHRVFFTEEREAPGPPNTTIVPAEAPELDRNVDRWGPVLNIPDAALVELVETSCLTEKPDRYDRHAKTTVKVLDQIVGRNNAVYVVSHEQSFRGHGRKVCVRVPACGWGDHWTPAHATALTNTALLMRLVEEMTAFPVPHVFAWDAGLDNAIGAPYIMTEHVAGRTLLAAWNPRVPSVVVKEERGFSQTAAELERLRLRMLRSLAARAAELRVARLAFAHMGAVHFPPGLPSHPRVRDGGLAVPFGRALPAGDDEPAFRRAESRSQTSYARRLEASLQAATAAATVDDAVVVVGLHRLYALLLAALPWPDPQAVESFALAPPPLADPSKVLVDPADGSVTAVLAGWDRAVAVPRLVGWAAVPDFLVEAGRWRDGLGGEVEVEGGTWDGYRAYYASCMREVGGGDGDVGFTRKSHLYKVVLEAVGRADAMREVLEEVVAAVMPREQVGALIRKAGGRKGLGEKKEDEVRRRFEELLAPPAGATDCGGTEVVVSERAGDDNGDC